MTDSDLTRLLALQDGFIVARALQLAAELGLADLMADGPCAAEDLAAATSTDAGALFRLLRTLAGAGVFTEGRPGYFALTPLSEHLRGDHPQSVRSYLRSGDVLARAFDAADHSLRTGTAAFDVAFGESFFDYLRGHPDRAAVFNRGMAELSAHEATAVVDAYDFAGARCIVDVGGGTGTLLRTVLARHTEPTGVLFDQPAVIAAAQQPIDAAGLAQRCVLAGGDFFHEVPAGGDVYLLKSVIHDWPDTQAVTILDNCRRAVAQDGRVLLIERVVPVGDGPHPSKPMDLAMLVLLGGRERTEDEYTALLRAAGLRVTRVLGTASALSVIEAVPNR